MRGIADRGDKFPFRLALLTSLGAGALGFFVCVVVLIAGVWYEAIPLHPILHKLLIALGGFAVCFSFVLGMLLQQAYWS